mmetsp:Transcript_3206/g.9077  ORF Transcript_3206/g.9077 Transcript_3206/m.9077 type:complete len:410 (-) Transcript_3206:543-1772(-)
MERASKMGRNCCMGIAKSVASHTLAETRCDDFPTLSLACGFDAHPPLCPTATASGTALAAFGASRLSCGGAPRRAPCGCGLLQSRLSHSLIVEAQVSGHCDRTSDAVDIVSMSGMMSPCCRKSALPAPPDVSDRLLSEGWRIGLVGTAKSLLKPSRSSGRQASGGRGHPKYSWKVWQFLREPFCRTVTPNVPRTSNRRAFQPLTSASPTAAPSHVVASVNSSASTCMSHCMTSAEMRSFTTALVSSLSNASVTSTTVCFPWLSKQRLGPAPSSPPLALHPGARARPPRNSVVRSRRLLRRNRFHDASVESTRNDVPCFLSQTTSDGAILFSSGTTGDSNSHLILHSKSGSMRRDWVMESSRDRHRCRRFRCVLAKRVRTSSSSPRLTASSSGDQPREDRMRGSAPLSRR